MPTSVGDRILGLWRRFEGRPGGKLLFAKLLGRMVPYSGTIKPRVLELEPGRAVVRIEDRRAVRNHLRSVHAIALANLGELTSGLAMTTSLGPHHRAIVTSLEIDYLKKARGPLVAEGHGEVPADLKEDTDVEVTATIRDMEEDLVATMRVQWRVGPAPTRESQ